MVSTFLGKEFQGIITSIMDLPELEIVEILVIFTLPLFSSFCQVVYPPELVIKSLTVLYLLIPKRYWFGLYSFTDEISVLQCYVVSKHGKYTEKKTDPYTYFLAVSFFQHRRLHTFGVTSQHLAYDQKSINDSWRKSVLFQVSYLSHQYLETMGALPVFLFLQQSIFLQDKIFLLEI